MIAYLKDIDLPEPGEWSSDALLDPMHPGHGPLPNLQGLIEKDGERFSVALWDTGNHILTFLELLKEEDPDESAPMLSMEEVHKVRGWIAQTNRWHQDVDAMVCHGHHVPMPGYPGVKEEEIWMREIYRLVMMEAVQLAAETALELNTIRRLSRLDPSR
jgi:hypothetical protein